MIRVKQLLSFLMFLVVMFSYQSIFSQGTTTAALNGKITDQKGDALPGANIIAVHQPTGTQYGTTSREDGRYNLLGLQVGGPYTVTVSFVGYTTQVEEGFSLALSQNLKIDFVLPEQAVELSGVTVTAEKGAILSQARTGAAYNVSPKSISEIPSISRTFQYFVKLSPLFSGEGLQAAGRSNRYNNIQIDGTQYNDLFGLGSTGTPGGQTRTNPISLDAINEFQVVVAPYDVRLSGFTGGGVNAITKSGTNKYSGSAYFYGRNEDFIGKNVVTKKDDYPKFNESQYGFTAGGPIIKDKLFFFVNGEMTINDSPLQNSSLINGFSSTVGPDSVRALANRMKELLAAKGMDAGSIETFTREQPSTKLFVRFDYNLSENHKLSLRNNFVDAYIDILNARSSNRQLAFDTYTYRIKNKTNATILQLHSAFGNNMSNELILGYTSIRDRRAGITEDRPEVEIREVSRGLAMFAGPDRFSSANELDQDIFEITDNFSYFAGDHTFTLGTHNEFFSFRNLFVRSFFGYYQYNSLADFQNDRVAFYQHNYSRTSDPNQAAEFDVMQFGFYVQDEWTISPKLKLTVGMRIDIPTFPENPARNDSVTKYFPQYSTDEIPSGNLLLSPRIGFNYDLSEDRTTQLRGGLGIFSGRVPYVWMSNNYGNTGTLYAEVRNQGTGLKFTSDPYNQWYPGDPGTGSPRLQSEVDIADPNLKLPQILRFNLGLDQQLPLGFIGTVEFLYSKTINDMLYRLGNLNPATGSIPVIGTGHDGRPVYGNRNSGNGNFFEIMELYNTSGGYQYNLSFQVQRNVARGISVNAAYTYGQAKDKNSVTSSQANSQMRFNAIDLDPNTPKLTTSNYEIEHRIFASLSYVHEFFENAATTFSLFYNGQSGRPFSFIVLGDLNNDGFDQNDLFYIPRNESEILLGTISSGQYVPASAKTYDDLMGFIEGNEYLRENKGKIAERNGAQNPWSEYVDVRITQDIPDLWGMGHFQLSLDIQNVLNLLNSDWGKQEGVTFDYQAVQLQGRINYNGKANTPVYSFSKPANNTPFTVSDTSSRWAMQFGIRYAF